VRARKEKKVSELKAQLGELSFVDLRHIHAWLTKEIDERQEGELEALRKRFREEADRVGFALELVLGDSKPLQVKKREKRMP
jgi:hypothetical protein